MIESQSISDPDLADMGGLLIQQDSTNFLLSPLKLRPPASQFPPGPLEPSRAFIWQNKCKSQNRQWLQNRVLLKDLCSFLLKCAPKDSSYHCYITILIHKIPASPHYPSLCFLLYDRKHWVTAADPTERSYWKGGDDIASGFHPPSALCWAPNRCQEICISNI